MAWRKSIPVALLLSLAVPTAGVKASSAAPNGTPAIHRVGNEGVSRRNGGMNSSRPKRRGEEVDQERLSEETISEAGEYLRSRGDSSIASDEATDAWERFYQQCDTVIRRFAATFHRRGVDVDDCTQEVWADLIQSLPNFKMDATRGEFNSWLYTIVRSKATNMVRKQSRNAAVELSPAVVSRVAASEPGPSERLDQKADCQSVRLAMAKLQAVASESSYQVLHLRYINGWNVQQVADVLGFSREQVWVREHRMKRKLRGLLEREIETPATSRDSLIGEGRRIA